MKKQNVSTPAVLVDYEVLVNNIKRYHDFAKENGKEILPMTKTHKCSQIAKLQLDMGASGLQVGTIFEAQQFIKEFDVPKIVFCYPYVTQNDLNSILGIMKKTKVILSLDNIEIANIYESFCVENDIEIDYLLLVNVGLNRFGINADQCTELVEKIQQTCSHLHFYGISTHPGQVYGASNQDEFERACCQEIEIMTQTCESLREAGIVCQSVQTGSTPTFFSEAKAPIFTTVKPGNYVFLDIMQACYDVDVKDCSLSVYTTVISKRDNNTFLIDAGAKCLGLDKGAHGNSNIVGYGFIKGYPNVIVASLSEEVGVIHSDEPVDIQIGDRLEIIPNHSCSVANLTSYIIAVKNDEVVGCYHVDARNKTASPIEGMLPPQR